MTRTEQIQAAKAFTEKHKDSHRVFLEEGYIEASARELKEKGMEYNRSFYDEEITRVGTSFKKRRIWALDQNGIATTDY